MAETRTVQELGELVLSSCLSAIAPRRLVTIDRPTALAWENHVHLHVEADSERKEPVDTEAIGEALARSIERLQAIGSAPLEIPTAPGVEAVNVSRDNLTLRVVRAYVLITRADHPRVGEMADLIRFDILVTH
jgi:hypothetical protein